MQEQATITTRIIEAVAYAGLAPPPRPSTLWSEAGTRTLKSRTTNAGHLNPATALQAVVPGRRPEVEEVSGSQLVALSAGGSSNAETSSQVRYSRYPIERQGKRHARLASSVAARQKHRKRKTISQLTNSGTSVQSQASCARVTRGHATEKPGHESSMRSADDDS